jgi:uncharacterized protein YijF (DUF1287 family)
MVGRWQFLWVVLPLGLAGCASQATTAAFAPSRAKSIPLVEGARDQLSWGTGYDPAYYKITYPGGDLPKSKGVCTDVVIRAYRHKGIDLQRLIHEDMVNHWDKYPRYKGLAKPDPNIDHRRVPNQKVFFGRFGKTLTLTTTNSKDWLPGDIVDWKIVGGYDHTGILTDTYDSDGYPYVIHNIGNGPQEEDVLRTWTWKITGHYRYP